MSRQNIGKPRIYLNYSDYAATRGTSMPPVYRTLPVVANEVSTDLQQMPGVYPSSPFTMTNPYFAILGHTLSVDNNTITFYQETSEQEGAGTTSITPVDVINGTSPYLDGFSIWEFSTVYPQSFQM